MPYKHNKSKSGVEVEQRNLTHSTVGLRASTSANSTDMPTIARIRARLVSLGTDEVTISQAVWVFGVSTPAPIRLRIERGELAAAKVMGEWRIDAASIHRYLDKVNKQFNKGM